MRIIYRVAVCDDMARDLEEMASVTATLLREAGMETRVEQFRSAVELLILKDLCEWGTNYQKAVSQ